VLVETVGSALLNSGVPAELLALEITESVLIDHAEGAGQVLAELKFLGVRLVLDDFGTGYSSLSYLNEFPLDSLKIDRSFTSELTNGPRGAKIVAATIEMARALGMTVIAEGVETQEQLDVLRKLGCQYAQGYLFAPAQPPAEVLAHMRARQPPVPDGGPRWAVRRGAKVPLRRLSDLGAEQARRRHQRALGQMAAWVFLAGTLVAVGGEVVLGASTGATTALLALLGLASATLCFVVPWDRLAPDWLHLMPALATVEVTVWALAAGRHGSVVEAFYLLIGTAVAYAFIDRRLIAAQVTLIAAAMLLPAVLTSHRGYDGVAQTTVTILVLAVTVALVVYLRERMEASTAELRELAARDPLTDVGNYRLLHERLEYELVRHTRERQPLAVLLVDLDHFKQVNERFGHAAGDEVLRRVGRALRDAVRQQDTVARPGGDEFAVLAPGTDADGALLLSDRIGERLSEIELGHVSVRATVGYAVFAQDGTTAPALLGQADEVLMARKRDRPTPRAAPESSLPAAAPQPRFV
jgi:diguanylate cyclase (GGDEF)-like protein